MLYLLKGFLIGLTVAIPVGPVGLLCLDMTVTHGRKVGLSCSLGMVSADIFSASIMMLGIGLFYSFLSDHANTVNLITGLIFAGLGIALILTRNNHKKMPNTAGMAGLTLSTFLLSISPATFGLMFFLFPALGLTENLQIPNILFGVALGSAVWGATILGAGTLIRRWLGDKISRFRGIVGSVFIAIGMTAVMLASINYLI